MKRNNLMIATDRDARGDRLTSWWVTMLVIALSATGALTWLPAPASASILPVDNRTYLGEVELSCDRIGANCWTEFNRSATSTSTWTTGDGECRGLRARTEECNVFRWIGVNHNGQRHRQRLNLNVEPNQTVQITVRSAYATRGAELQVRPSNGRGSVAPETRVHSFAAGYHSTNEPTATWVIKAKANRSGQIYLNIEAAGSDRGNYIYLDYIEIDRLIYGDLPTPKR